MGQYPPCCYYCIIKDFQSVNQYERHIVIYHPNLPGYSGPADIKFYGLEKQSMQWENPPTTVIYSEKRKFKNEVAKDL
jgi:hypothetical protein